VKADHVLWVGDIREGLDAIARAAEAALGADTQFTLIANKIDLDATTARQFTFAGREVIAVSALQRIGMQAVIERLKTLAGLGSETAGTFSARRRHLDALNQVDGHLTAAVTAIEEGLELAAEELRAAQEALSALTGEFTSDDLLGEIFSSFCIGK
jgi:tRNA modification GTPase